MVDVKRCVICGEFRVGPELLARVIVDFNDLLNHDFHLIFWRFFMLFSISQVLSVVLEVLFITVLVLELLIRHLILIVLLFFYGDTLILSNKIS